ncbi:MAG TPA: glycoside hydrolase family 25 protein [Flavobacterium sp.]|nr:glycoside hydrolase family 25 protein [Flavobacterium sp.]
MLSFYHYRVGLTYYFGLNVKRTVETAESKHLSDVRNFQLLNKYRDKVVGFDVSEYQGKIKWEKVGLIEKTFPIGFVFIRATVGSDKIDLRFKDNWISSKKKKIIRGAYHYYRPNENSREQAENFIKTVKLEKGDMPPVLDIERLPENQSLDSLKAGLKRWLEIVDAHYKVKPIIYTGEKYYNEFLKDEFSEYTFWIANYNFFEENIKDEWLFWQFTQKASIPGLHCIVDLNIYNGTPKMLQYMTVN